MVIGGSREAGPRSDSEGRLADNIVQFTRALRRAGLRPGPAQALDAVEAVILTGLASRDDFYWALHSTLVSRREDRQVFDEVFARFWRSRELVERMIAMLSPTAPPRNSEPPKQKTGARRAADALAGNDSEPAPPVDKPVLEADARMTVSDSEVLRRMDFAQMSALELASARKAIAGLRLPDDRIMTRRFVVEATGRRIDPRATMRSAMRAGGDVILPRYRSRFRKPATIVVLADVSGSMAQYSRVLLHFAHALMERRTNVHAFLFGTRLTNVTRYLRRRDPDEAFAQCSDIVTDWAGGTRIAEALHRFNKDWSRRVLGQGATVLLITDGLERESRFDLGAETERLHLSCRRLIWLNPLLRFEEFSARAKGVRAMLRHVDEFRPAHSLAALDDLCRALADRRRQPVDPRTWLRQPVARDAFPASATGQGNGAFHASPWQPM